MNESQNWLGGSDGFFVCIATKVCRRCWKYGWKKQKALTARLRKGLNNLVAGAGFEPTTFGL